MKRFFLILLALITFFLFVPFIMEEAYADMLLYQDEMNDVSATNWNNNEDELALAYITQIMPGKQRIRASRPSGFSLEGFNYTLYSLISEKISVIAAGNEQSTEFQFTPSEIYEKISFSENDLNVSIKDDQNRYNPEAINLVRAIRDSLDIPKVINCIMSDFPQYLYWFGKNYNYNMCNISGRGDTMIFTGSINIKMTVAEDYATVTTSDGETTYSPYEIDNKYGQAVQAAAENANAILRRYQGRSDFELLSAYRDEICTLTSFNSEAGAGQYQFDYGNPWQLVWVFDGDPETKVVCEGYAKAFNYLCDIGTNSAVSIIVQGYRNIIAVSHAHMWNIVTIDEHNYLVDLTSYDQGADAFLVGASDGNVEDGYTLYSGAKYYYNRVYTPRTDAELTLPPFSYEEWRTVTTTVPTVQISSNRTYPGQKVVLKINSRVPFQQVIIAESGDSETIELENNTALLSISEDASFTIAGVVDGTVTPATAPIGISVDSVSQAFTLPAGSRIETDAFTGIAAEYVMVNENEIEPGAFDADTVLVVDEIGDWFNSGYQFVISE